MSAIPWRETGPPVSPEQLAAVEEELGVTFPLSYVRFVLARNGARAFPARPIFHVGTRERVLRRFLRIDPGTPELSIVQNWKWIRDRIPKGTIPFATDIAQNHICFDFRSADEPKVVLCDHEYDSDEAVDVLAARFEEFLSSLVLEDLGDSFSSTTTATAQKASKKKASKKKASNKKASKKKASKKKASKKKASKKKASKKKASKKKASNKKASNKKASKKKASKKKASKKKASKKKASNKKASKKKASKKKASKKKASKKKASKKKASKKKTRR